MFDEGAESVGEREGAGDGMKAGNRAAEVEEEEGPAAPAS